jgi:hypothetical protein
MQLIWFEAPALDDPDAPPLDDREGLFHDAPGVLAALGRQKRLALWLRDQLRAKGIAVGGPQADEDGWGLQITGADGFVVASLIRKEGAQGVFGLHLMSLDADAETERTTDALEEIFSQSGETRLLEIDRDA